MITYIFISTLCFMNPQFKYQGVWVDIKELHCIPVARISTNSLTMEGETRYEVIQKEEKYGGLMDHLQRPTR